LFIASHFTTGTCALTKKPKARRKTDRVSFFIVDATLKYLNLVQHFASIMPILKTIILTVFLSKKLFHNFDEFSTLREGYLLYN
jgi:hypothetical protein